MKASLIRHDIKDKGTEVAVDRRMYALANGRWIIVCHYGKDVSGEEMISVFDFDQRPDAVTVFDIMTKCKD